MADDRTSKSSADRLVRSAGRWVISVFWAIQFIELSVVALIQGRDFAIRLLPERIIIVAAGMILTLIFVELAMRLSGLPFRRRLILTFGIALLLCVVLVAFAYQVAFLPIWNRPAPDLVGFIYTGFAWSWFFLSVAAAFLALSFSIEMRGQSEQLAALGIVARDARLAALRYQLNPHFLFNTLNSIAGLIGAGEKIAAEAMVENLADFLRATLELDVIGDVDLRSEIRLQELYLAIEQVRFPDRLCVDWNIDEGLLDARVPALITQPLIENSIVHAVARSTGMVTLRIRALADGQRLVLVVEDDGGVPVGVRAGGFCKGIRNVRDRLAAQFGTDQAMESGAIASGGYRTILHMPISLPRPGQLPHS